MKSKITAILIALVLLFPIITHATGSDSDIYLPDANKLYELGLFKGTDIGFELDRQATRAEAAVMLVRLLGLEETVLNGEFNHPFKDVPEWAEKYVGYLYEEELTYGIDSDTYGSQNFIDARSFATFALRAMGYSDREGDFEWDSALDSAYEKGLFGSYFLHMLKSNTFRRAEMTALSYLALNTPIKDSTATLAGELAGKGSIDGELASDLGFLMAANPIYECLPYLEPHGYLPELVGDDLETALIELRNIGFTDINLEYKYDEYFAKDTVLEQSFNPYFKIQADNDFILTISKGPDPYYHEELKQLCIEMEWPLEVHPYILSACKYIIKELPLNKTEVVNRLKSNLKEIDLFDIDESTEVSFLGRFFDREGLMQISALGLDEEIITHELLHVLSYDPESGKSGLSPDGISYNQALEGYTSYLSSKRYFVNNEFTSVYTFGDTVIKTYSDIHYCNGSYDRYLELLSPIFQLAGDNVVEKMYFAPNNIYKTLIAEFNSVYGTGRWEELMSLSEQAMSHVCNMTDEQAALQVEKFKEYYDCVIECLEIDHSASTGSEEELSDFFDKLSVIKNSFPLEFNEYREKLLAFESRVSQELKDYGIDALVAGNDTWIVPEFYGKPEGVVFSWIQNMGRNSHGMTYSSGTSDMQKGAVEAIKFREGSEGSYRDVNPGDILPLDGEYIVIIPKEGSALAHEGYYAQRDLLEDFKNNVIDFSNPEEFVLVRILNSDGIDVRIEYSYGGKTGDYMEGRLIGIYPCKGSAMLPGQSTVVLTFLKGLD